MYTFVSAERLLKITGLTSRVAQWYIEMMAVEMQRGDVLLQIARALSRASSRGSALLCLEGRKGIEGG